MIRLIYLYITVITLIHALPKRKIGRQEANQENKDQKPTEKFRDVEDDPYVRYIIEDGVKNPLFGSARYDPINQVFMISDKPCTTTTQSAIELGETHADEMSSTVMTEGPTEATPEATAESESPTETAAPPAEDRKQFVNFIPSAKKPCKTNKTRTVKGRKTTVFMKSTSKKLAKTTTSTWASEDVTESITTSHATEGWWSRRKGRKNNRELLLYPNYRKNNNLQK